MTFFRKNTLLTLLCLAPLALHSQKNYFQQEVNTVIHVALDDQKNRLTGDIGIEYTNHSPDALSEIWMHCWANAYKNRQSAFSKQQLRLGSGRFYFAPDTLLGGFRGLAFVVEGQNATWRWDKNNPDIAVITLETPLQPGAKIKISTPFTLKIPDSFSRLGHVGQSYQMTQWFPKPAVYDNRGWHAMPYLNMGEFYSEFGTYDVSITLPDNYVVGATGALQTPSEIQFLQQKETETRAKLAKGVDEKDLSFPPSSTKTKTIRFTADKVHDFAWFADKRFLVLKDTARLAKGQTVDCWAMFSNEGASIWKKGAFYVRRSVEYYSERVGAYPWPHATAVLSALSAGGGMEYPMITVINNERTGKALDDVITHEVGHNWFYGLLASNERDHPFMDEGMNSYFESGYMMEYYNSFLGDDYIPKKIIDREKHGGLTEIGYLAFARQHIDIPPDTHSDNFNFLQYGLQVYMKTAICLNWLEQAMGRDVLDHAWKVYFDQWKFKHPYPEDFVASMKESHVNIDWFMQTMQTKDQFDLDLKKIRKTDLEFFLTVENKGQIAAPFPITAFLHGEIVGEIWYPAMTGTKELSFPTNFADAFEIDHHHITLDVNRKNNYRKTSGLLPGFRPLKLNMTALREEPARATLGVLPWLGWNNYDKTLIGLLFYNPPLPSQKFQFYVAPGLGLGSKNVTGIVDLRYKMYPKHGLMQRVTLGLSGKKFTQDHILGDQYLEYTRVVPSIKLDLRSPALSFHHYINLRAIFINQENPDYDSTGQYTIKKRPSAIYEARYRAERTNLPNPYRFTATLEMQDYENGLGQKSHYLRAGLEWKQQFFYKAKRKVSARVYGGFFLKNTNKTRNTLGFGDPDDLTRGTLSLSKSNYTDYRYDHLIYGRNVESGILARQNVEEEGGFKYGFGAANALVTGHSNAYIMALNLKADLPQRLPWGLPLKPWLDVGYAKNLHSAVEITKKDQVFWNAGLMLGFFGDNLSVYFPLAHSKNLQNLYNAGNYGTRISWSVNLNDLEPVELLNRVAR